MGYLVELIEKRKEVGKRPWNPQGGTTNYNNRAEYERLGNLIIDEVNRLYDKGKLYGV